VPTFFINHGGYPKDWAEFRAEAHEWYKGANLQKSYLKPAMEESLARRLKDWESSGRRSTRRSTYRRKIRSGR